MFETILILLFSLALFAYWFRYTVLLLLGEESTANPGPVIEQLNLSQSRAALDSGDVPLERLHSAIEKDYRLILYLLDHAAGLGLRPFEHHLLILDYRVMALWYGLTRNASAVQAQRALAEMLGVLTCIARKMGERAAAASHA